MTRASSLATRVGVSAQVSGIAIASGSLIAIASGWLIANPNEVGTWSMRWLTGTLAILCIASLCIALPRGAVSGVAAGAFLLGINVVGWTVPRPGLWLVLIEFGVSASLIFFALTRRKKRRIPLFRDPLFLVGVFPWIPAVASSLINGSLNQAAQRVLTMATYAGFLAAAGRVEGRRFAWGVVVGVQGVAVALLVAATSRPTASTIFGANRFSGGKALLVHPNILGMAAWTTGCVWLALPGPRWPARIPGVIVCSSLVFLTDSRTSAGAGLIAAAVALVVSQGRREWRSSTQRAAFVTLVVAAIVGGGYYLGHGYFDRQRASAVGTLSGRPVIWRRALSDFAHAPLAEKVLGSTLGGAAAGVDVGPLGHTHQTVDDAYLGLLRRGGVVALAFGLLGWAGIVRVGFSSMARRELAAASALIVGALATTPVEGWFFGGALWIWIVAAIRLAEDGGVRSEVP